MDMFKTKTFLKTYNFILALVLSIPLLSYQPKKVQSEDLANEKYLNYLAAVQNLSTFSYFTVIKVKNIKTDEVKEICTKGNFVAGALHIELGAGYDKAGRDMVLAFVKDKKERYFEFKNKKALNNISFFEYNEQLVDEVQARYSFEKVEEIIERDKEFSISLSKQEMKAFAHILFNRGYLTGENNCYGGELEYVARPISR